MEFGKNEGGEFKEIEETDNNISAGDFALQNFQLMGEKEWKMECLGKCYLFLLYCHWL